jgi:hypothetical protein
VYTGKYSLGSFAPLTLKFVGVTVHLPVALARIVTPGFGVCNSCLQHVWSRRQPGAIPMTTCELQEAACSPVIGLQHACSAHFLAPDQSVIFVLSVGVAVSAGVARFAMLVPRSYRGYRGESDRQGAPPGVHPRCINAHTVGTACGYMRLLADKPHTSLAKPTSLACYIPIRDPPLALCPTNLPQENARMRGSALLLCVRALSRDRNIRSATVSVEHIHRNTQGRCTSHVCFSVLPNYANVNTSGAAFAGSEAYQTCHLNPDDFIPCLDDDHRQHSLLGSEAEAIASYISSARAALSTG